MPEITRITNDIIEGAYKIIGVFSEESNLPQHRIIEGLDYLNKLLDQFASSSVKIAYNDTITFPLVVGQTSYEISNKVGADVSSNPLVIMRFVTLQDGDIVFPLEVIPDNIFFNRRRDTTLTGTPSQVFLQNAVDESNLNFVIKPDKAYSCVVKGKFVLNHVSLNQPINQIPASYHLFLELALGRILRGVYPGSDWSASDESNYTVMKKDLESANDLDVISITSSSLMLNKRHNNGILST